MKCILAAFSLIFTLSSAFKCRGAPWKDRLNCGDAQIERELASTFQMINPDLQKIEQNLQVSTNIEPF